MHRRRRTAYVYREPFVQGRIAVGDGHVLYYEESGNPDGLPVVLLHGGPGSGCRPKQRSYFDPERFRIVQFDQRGCGRSAPHGHLDGNTTPHLVADIERLRCHLGIDRWLVFGGSWGSTLGLAYTLAHAEAVLGLVLWGVFTGSPDEIDWTFGPDGAARLYPLEYERFLEPLPPAERADPIAGHYAQMIGSDMVRRRHSLRAWTRWENKISDVVVSDAVLDEQLADERYVLTHSLFEAHYFNHGCFLAEPLLAAAARLGDVPVEIVQGRLDMVCPAATAVALHRQIAGSRLQLIEGAGHSPNADVVDALIRAVDHLARALAPPPRAVPQPVAI
ncbi:MAG: prolyl aminopeptidase [Geminicoccaceae bacterium]|nr:MAG: prolyl aminopeptidase [Geminicoccaceae bacterium]